jgi:hypothetical protein
MEAPMLPLVLAVGLLQVVLTLAIIGLIVWLIVTYIPMPDVVKKVIMVLVAIVMILYLARALGLTDMNIGINP